MIRLSSVNHTKYGGSFPVNSGRWQTLTGCGVSIIPTAWEEKGLQLPHYGRKQILDRCHEVKAWLTPAPFESCASKIIQYFAKDYAR
jgi:hypothetical protein